MEISHMGSECTTVVCRNELGNIVTRLILCSFTSQSQPSLAACQSWCHPMPQTEISQEVVLSSPRRLALLSGVCFSFRVK